MMKSRFLLVLIFVATGPILQLASGPRSASLPDSYPLVCRGVETFTADYSSCEGCGNAGEARKYVGFRFIRGSKPSGKGLAPGECSWLDRAMLADEPNLLVQELDAIGGVEKYAWTSELRSSKSYWTFNVYSSRGRLWATGAERNGKLVVFDRDRFPGSILEVRSPDLYIAQVKVIDHPLPLVGTARLAVRVGNRGTADAG